MSKYTEEEKEQIIKLHKEGLSSRKIAKQLDRSKSGINALIASLRTTEVVAEIVKETIKNIDSIVHPKILLIDIETMASLGLFFGRRKQNISVDAVTEEGGWIISYAYQWLGSKEIKSSVVTPEEAITRNDLRLVAELHDLIEQADYVVGHNINGFDLPVIKTRTIINKLPPMRKVRTIDTLVLAKPFRFNSNKLDGLCKQLEVERKVQHRGISLWVDCHNGDPEALKDMLYYNEGDIPTLLSVYLHLRPHSNIHPNLAVNQGDVVRCNVCLSDQIEETGNDVTTNLSVFPEYKCKDCGARFRGRKAKTTKEERANFLAN